MYKDEMQRMAAAYHEAGHAVIAYQVGCWVNPDGVEIDRRQYTGLCCREYDHNEWRRVWTALAGWLSEYCWHGRGGFHSDMDLEYCINEARLDEDETMGGEGDDIEVFSAILESHSDSTDETLIAIYRKYEKEVWETLADDRVWSAITEVAEALFKKGALTASEVEALMAKGDRSLDTGGIHVNATRNKGNAEGPVQKFRT